MANWEAIHNATGASDDTEAMQIYNQKKLLRLKAAGGTDEEILGTNKKSLLLENEMTSFWQNPLEAIEDWAVGDDADWQTYWERGLGKSNINLWMQHRASQGKTTFGKTGYDWRTAFDPEPEDTGAIERLFETLASLGADAPTFGVGAAIGSLTGNPFGTGFGAGFVNDSIKHMYLAALERGDVDTFGEFWNMFLKHGVKEGIKGGLTVGAMSVAPAALPYLKLGKWKPPINKFTVASSRWAALTGVGSAVEGQLPTKELMVNNALILGMFGFVDPKANKMVQASALKNKTDGLTITEQLSKDVVMKQEAGSKNKKTFSKDKKLVESEITNLKEKLAELNKLDKESKPKVIKSKEIETQRIEKEIKTLKQNIKEAKTESIESLNKTKLETLEKELIDIKEDKGKVIEEKDVETFTKEQNVRLEKELVELESKRSDVQAEINLLKQRKKNNQFYNDSRLKLLKIKAKKHTAEIENKRTLLNKDKTIAEIEKKLAENGEPVIKTFEKNKEFKQHKNENINWIFNKTASGKTKLINQSIESVKNSFIKSWLDRLYPIWKLVENAKKRGVKLTSWDVYKQMRIQMGNIGKGFHFIKKATFDFKTLKDNGKSFVQVLDKAIKTTENYQEFTSFAIAKRAMEKYEQGISTIFSLTKENRQRLTQVIKEFEGKYGETFKELNLYQQRVLTYLKDAGVLSTELYAKVLELNQDYVPLNKVLDISLLTKNNKGNTGLGTMVKNPLKKMEGTPKDLVTIDPIETMFLNTLHFIQIAEKNSVNKAFIKMSLEAQKLKNRDVYDPFADIYEVKNIKETKVSAKELESLFLDSKGISETIKQGLTVLRKQDGWLKDTEIPVYENGKLRVYEIGMEYATALRDVNIYQAKVWARIAAVPTKTLRAGATLDPAFIIKNFGRDTFFATAFSKNNFIPIWSSLKGLFHLVREKKTGDALYAKFMKSGAMQSTLISFDRSYFKDGQMLAELTKRTLHNGIKPQNWLESLRVFSEIMETSSRLEDFRMTMIRLEKKNSKLSKNKQISERQIMEEAGFEARDLTVDFRKMGNHMQGYNMISAFFNARVQGLLKIKEGLDFVSNPKRAAKVLAQSMLWITVPSMLLWYKNKDSQVYKDLPQWQKDLSWIIIADEGTPDQIVWRIPKPFEIGWLFGTLPERIADWMYQENPDSFKDSVIDLTDDLIASLGPIPEIAKPFIEDSRNENWFFERPIVPYNLEKILPEYQYTEYTSETAKLIAMAFAKVRESLGMEELWGPSLDSPNKVQNYIQAWTGGLGKHMLDILDYSFKTIGIVTPPVKPWSDNWVRNLSDIIIIKAFVVRHPSASAEPVHKFWKLYRPIKTKMDTFEKLMSDNNVDEAMKVWESIDPELLYLIEMSKPIKEMGDVISLIYKNDGISANDKRQLIDGFYENMINIAKEAVKLKKELMKK